MQSITPSPFNLRTMEREKRGKKRFQEAQARRARTLFRLPSLLCKKSPHLNPKLHAIYFGQSPVEVKKDRPRCFVCARSLVRSRFDSFSGILEARLRIKVIRVV